MIQVAILTRRLKEGKTYEDFRKVWYHTVGFGTANRMYTVINAFDPREIIVIGFTEMTLEDIMAELRIDVKERPTAGCGGNKPGIRGTRPCQRRKRQFRFLRARHDTPYNALAVFQIPEMVAIISIIDQIKIFERWSGL